MGLSNSEETIRSVKLLLDESQESRYRPALESKKILKRLDKDAVEVSGDYLRKLVSNVKEVLKRRFGAAFGSMEMRFILSQQSGPTKQKTPHGKQLSVRASLHLISLWYRSQKLLRYTASERFSQIQ